MASDRQIIEKMNSIRGMERRMALLYKRGAELVTGPYRAALVEEFMEHADVEDAHAGIVSRRILAMGGDLDTYVNPIPVCRNLNDLLEILDELEEEGVKNWQELERMLSKDDPFRHTISTILDQEVEHTDDVKLWLRRDHADKSVGALSSNKPLNWQDPQFHQPVGKSAHWQDRLHSYSQHGTPPTRRGAFNGHVPSLEPALPAEMNPVLRLEKAVLQPTMSGASKQQFQRKRDASGKFAPAGSAGAETTAAEDVTDEKRKAELRAAKQRESLKKPFQEARAGSEAQRKLKREGLVNKAMVPGMAGPDAIETAQSQQLPGQGGELVTTLSSGKPLYSDPYHPEHEAFTPQDHQEAADIYDDEADAAFSAGEVEESMQDRMRAEAHRSQVQDQAPPMDRAFDVPSQRPAQSPKQNGGGQNPAQQMQEAFKALNYSYSPDSDLDQFTQQRDMQQPSFGQRTEGPIPGMQHTSTGGPVGPQTNPGAFTPEPVAAPSPMGSPAASPPMTSAPQMSAGSPMMSSAPPPPLPASEELAGGPTNLMSQGQPPVMDAGGPAPMDVGGGGMGTPPMDDTQNYDELIGYTPGASPADLTEQDMQAIQQRGIGSPPEGLADMIQGGGGEGDSEEEAQSPIGAAPTEEKPPNPFGGNDVDAKKESDEAPEPMEGAPGPGTATNDDSSDGSPAFKDGMDQGPDNEPLDEKKTYGLDALKSWSARY